MHRTLRCSGMGRGYDKVLFCDSDVLFRQSIQELFALEQALICCGDGLYYQGGYRDPASFAVVSEATSGTTAVLRNTFNSGFLLIDGTLLSAAQYARLLALVDEQVWRPFTDPRTADQLIFNIYFAGQQTLVSCKYNDILQYRALLYEKEGISLMQASMLHFNIIAKPWQADQMLSATQRDPALIPALKFWYAAYLECLQALHLTPRFSAIPQ